jgi:hypothetical protein
MALCCVYTGMGIYWGSQSAGSQEQHKLLYTSCLFRLLLCNCDGIVWSSVAGLLIALLLYSSIWVAVLNGPFEFPAQTQQQPNVGASIRRIEKQIVERVGRLGEWLSLLTFQDNGEGWLKNIKKGGGENNSRRSRGWGLKNSRRSRRGKGLKIPIVHIGGKGWKIHVVQLGEGGWKNLHRSRRGVVRFTSFKGAGVEKFTLFTERGRGWKIHVVQEGWGRKNSFGSSGGGDT